METLSVTASRVWRLIDRALEAMEADAGFDGGEFSGPASYRALDRAVAATLAECGWSAEDFGAALVARTSESWVHKSLLDLGLEVTS